MELQAGFKRLAQVSVVLADRTYPRGRLLLGDEAAIRIG